VSGAEDLLARLRRSIFDERVLAAIAAVPRERFVAPELAARAYENAPLEIGLGQTISQPLVVARMCLLLRLAGDERVLDVGTGSGYHAAVLAQLARHVYGVERHAELAELARANLAAAGVANVTVTVGDGRDGWPERAPFDAINVAAAATAIPAALAAQLADGGRLVAPLARGGDQHLYLVRRRGDTLQRTRLERVLFVPLR